jgi:hypothetical protein
MIYFIAVEADAPPAAIELFEDRIQALPSLWFVSTDWSAEEIRSHLQPHLSPKDSLIVEPVSGNVEWLGNVRLEVRDWLERHLA